MALIGNPLITTNYITDSFSGDNSTVAFTLSQAPASAQSIAVFISGLYQIPTSAYSISGTTLTFTAAPPTGTSNILVLHLGVQNQNLVPSAASITPAMLNNANVIYWSTSNNNVGIGTTTPAAALHVNGGRSYFTANSEAFATYLRYNNSTAGVFLGSPAANSFQISNSGGGALFNIDGSGNVGVGASSPVGKLDVYSSSGPSVYVRDATVQSLLGTDTSSAYYGTNGAYPLRLVSNNATRMTIAANGNIGIGTTTPTTGYGVTIDNGAPTTGEYSPLVLKGGSSSENGGQLGLWNTYAGVSNPKKWIRVDNSGRLAVVNSGYTAQIFSLDDSGNLSVGGTLSTSSRGITKASMPSGSIIQVQYSAPTNLGAVSRSSSTWGEITSSWRVSITPSSSSSILKITCHFCFDTTGANSYLDHFKFYDITNNAEVLVGDANGSRTRCLMASRGAAYDANDPVWMSFTAIIPAGSTTARTYGVYHKVESGSPSRTFFGSSLTSSSGWQTAPVFFIEEIAQ